MARDKLLAKRRPSLTNVRSEFAIIRDLPSEQCDYQYGTENVAVVVRVFVPNPLYLALHDVLPMNVASTRGSLLSPHAHKPSNEV